MCVAREIDPVVSPTTLVRARIQHVAQADELSGNDEHLSSSPKFEGGNTLVVAAASGVHLPAYFARNLSDAPFNSRMNVFIRFDETKRLLRKLDGDFF